MLKDQVWSFWLLTVLSIVVIIGMAYWFTRFAAGSRALQQLGWKRGGKQMEILAQLTLGRDQRLAVARVGKQHFLLGITASQISLLSEISEEDAAAWETPPEPASEMQPPHFREAFMDVLKQKTRR